MCTMTIRRFRWVMLITPFVLGFVGCSDKSAVQERTKISTPEGTTTITKESKVESSGSNPPAANTTRGTDTPR